MHVRRVKGQAGALLEKAMKDAERKVARVGWFPSAKYTDGTPVAYVAAIQEYGVPAKNIPSRSFMRTTIAEKQKKWTKTIESGSKAVLRGVATVDEVLEGVAMQAEGDIAKKITQIYTPPLKPATIAARLRRRADKKTIGSLTKPLIDTGIMLNTLSHEVTSE